MYYTFLLYCSSSPVALCQSLAEGHCTMAGIAEGGNVIAGASGQRSKVAILPYTLDIEAVDTAVKVATDRSKTYGNPSELVMGQT